jgi:rubrerythrin
LDEITDAQPIEDGASIGMASVIADLIKDEYEAIDGYNSAIATAQAEGFEDMINVLTEIQAEENLHIGQLQAIMNTLDPNAHLVDDGQQEGIEQLSGDLSMDGLGESLTEATHCVYFTQDGIEQIEFEGTEDECQDYIEKQEADNEFGDEAPERFVKRINEDLDDMSLQDQRMFIRCVNEIWDMSVMEWTHKYYSGQLEVTTVNSYDDIPDTSNLIEIGSSDISQGTGNVIVYTYMDAGDGSLYRYASF